MKTTILAQTKHVCLEQRDSLKKTYWVVWYNDNSGKLWGYQIYYDLDEAYQAAIKHIRRS